MNSFFFLSSELIVNGILIVSIVVNKVFFQIKKFNQALLFVITLNKDDYFNRALLTYT